MAEKVLKMVADSLKEARKKVSEKIPAGQSVLHEKVISDGKPKTYKKTAETKEEAFDKVMRKIPSEANILNKKVVTYPKESLLEIQAADEPAARTEAEKKISDSQFILDVSLKEKGKKGFLGIGSQPDTFEVRVRQNAVVEISYVQKAEVHAKIGVKPYKFRNQRFYSGRPISKLLGVILLAQEGEAKKVASSQVFFGTVEDTVGAYFQNVKKHPVIAIGHPKTLALFNMAASGAATAQESIINTGIESSLKNTRNVFPPKPAKKHYYHVGAMPSNEKTGNPFLVLAVYK